MKKAAFYITILIFGIVVLSYIFLHFGNENDKNGFERKLVDVHLKLKGSVILINPFNFTGKSNQDILLNNIHDKSRLFRIDFGLTKIDTIKLNFTNRFDTANVFSRRFQHFIFLTNPLGEIIKLNKNVSDFYKIAKLRFDFFVPTSENTIIARENHAGKSGRQLVKITLSKKPTVTKKYIIPKQVDGFFCNDGFLYYDETKSNLFYMYFYRGEFLCLDTNLNLTYRAKTIDTITKAKIKTSFIPVTLKNGTRINKTFQSTPRILTNRYFSTSNGRVYVLSGLKSDNETSSDFQKNHPIDVYSIKNGKYLHSFYIQKYKGQRLNLFEIHGNTIICLFGSSVVSYDFYYQ